MFQKRLTKEVIKIECNTITAPYDWSYHEITINKEITRSIYLIYRNEYLY